MLVLLGGVYDPAFFLAKRGWVEANWCTGLPQLGVPRFAMTRPIVLTNGEGCGRIGTIEILFFCPAISGR